MKHYITQKMFFSVFAIFYSLSFNYKRKKINHCTKNTVKKEMFMHIYVTPRL